MPRVAFFQAELGGPCLLHPRGHECGVPIQESTDVLAICFPCQPFSILRDHSKKSVESMTSRIWRRRLSHHVHRPAHLPHILVVEQVMGFEKKDSAGSTYKANFMDKILRIQNREGTGGHFAGGVTLALTPELFADCSRSRSPRLQLV